MDLSWVWKLFYNLVAWSQQKTAVFGEHSFSNQGIIFCKYYYVQCDY